MLLYSPSTSPIYLMPTEVNVFSVFCVSCSPPAATCHFLYFVFSGYGDRDNRDNRAPRSGYAGRDGRNREYDRRSGTGRLVLKPVFLSFFLRWC